MMQYTLHFLVMKPHETQESISTIHNKHFKRNMTPWTLDGRHYTVKTTKTTYHQKIVTFYKSSIWECLFLTIWLNAIETFSLQTNSSIRASPRLSPRLSPRISPRPSPCLSPCLRRSLSSGSRSNSWKRRRSQDGDRKCLVPECKIDSMDTDDDDVFQPNCPTPNRSV